MDGWLHTMVNVITYPRFNLDAVLDNHFKWKESLAEWIEIPLHVDIIIYIW